MLTSCLKLSQTFQNVVGKRLKSFSIRNLRVKVNTGQKDDSGEAIKRLNAENKCLFGNLLETRSERNKKLAQNGYRPMLNSFVVDKKDYKHAEISWSTKFVKNFTSSRKESVQSELKNVDCTNDRAQIEARVPLAISHANDHNSSDSVFSLNSKESEMKTIEYSKPAVKKTSIQLPDIIVRNIPSFPLTNDVKKKDIGGNSDIILRFSLTDCKDQKYVSSYPSVTKILSDTMSDASLAALQQWKDRMILELGEEGFQKYHKDLLAKGSQFHSVVQSFLSGTPEEDLVIDDPQIEGCWHSLSKVIPSIENVQVIESHVAHSSLMYKGIIDCVAYYKGKPVLIEWKKSDKPKPQLEKTYDAPLQMSAYLGALNFDNCYNFQLKQGLVVVAYTDGSLANVFPVNVSESLKYWRGWLMRLQKYWLKQSQLKTESQALF